MDLQKKCLEKVPKKNILPNGDEFFPVMYRRPFRFFDYRNPLEVNSMSKFLLIFFRGPSENEPKKQLVRWHLVGGFNPF